MLWIWWFTTWNSITSPNIVNNYYFARFTGCFQINFTNNKNNKNGKHQITRSIFLFVERNRLYLFNRIIIDLLISGKWIFKYNKFIIFHPLGIWKHRMLVSGDNLNGKASKVKLKKLALSVYLSMCSGSSSVPGKACWTQRPFERAPLQLSVHR